MLTPHCKWLHFRLKALALRADLIRIRCTAVYQNTLLKHTDLKFLKAKEKTKKVVKIDEVKKS